ncbi:MAG: hypothetical protein JWP78_3145 [Mucilaginibacter sp.]|nr:hypothetical protein [Mucilaginibacter sp.]
MLTAGELVKEISTTVTKIKVVKLSAILEKQQFALPDLIDITFHLDKNVAFRAAWILENLFLQKPEHYLNDMDYLLWRIKDVKNPSCKRHYAKIVMRITSLKVPLNIERKLADINLEPATEQLFDWIIDPKVLIAVKVFAVQALFNIRHRYPWVAEELANQIRFLMHNGSAAIQSRGKKLLSQL